MQSLQAFCEKKVKELKDAGKFAELRVVEGPAQAVVKIGGRDIIQLSSNNYLGLTTHPKMVAAAKKAIDDYGVGTAAVRPIIGTQSIHTQYEEKLARFKHTEAALVFQSGYTVNVGVVTALMWDDENNLIVSDELNHASIIDGIRLSRCDKVIFKHKNYEEMEAALQQAQKDGRDKVLCVTDGVFSMDGDVADLPKFAEICRKYGAISMVDDAHASGVFGKAGRGTVDHFGLHGKIDIQIGTLSKAIGAVGGYVACPKALRDYLVHKSRPFLFSSSHPASVIATCMAAIDVLESEPQILERLWDNTRFFKAGLKELGFNTGPSESPITPVIVGSSANAFKLSRRLFEEGVLAKEIIFPMVPDHLSRVRTIVMATHTRDHLQTALNAFAKIGRELGVIK